MGLVKGAYPSDHDRAITIKMAEGGVPVIRELIISLEEQLSKFPADLLDVVCADAHLVQLTECFSEWQTHLATSLQLTPVEVEDIERAWPRDPATQRIKMFRRWKSKLSSQATYRSVLDLQLLNIYTEGFAIR